MLLGIRRPHRWAGIFFIGYNRDILVITMRHGNSFVFFFFAVVGIWIWTCLMTVHVRQYVQCSYMTKICEQSEKEPQTKY